MKRKNLMLFSGVVALFVAYAVYDFQQEKKAENLKDEKSRLIWLKADQINFIAVENKNGKIELQKSVDGWNVISPVQDAANNTVVDDFVQGLTTEKTKESIEGGGKKLDLALFGLDHPQGSISIRDNLGDKLKIEVGTVKNFQGDSYLKADDRAEVAMGSSTWFAKVDKKVDDFRDRRLMRIPASKIQSFVIEKNKEKFEIASRDAKWILVDNSEVKLDQNKVREFITQLNMSEAIEFILDKNIQKTQLAQWNLIHPAWQVTVHFSDNKVWHVAVAEGKDKVFRAHVSSPEFVLKISPTDEAKFSAYSRDMFRDRNEPFNFEKDKIENIEIITALKSSTLRRSKESASVVDLLNRVQVLQVKDFTTQKEYSGFGKTGKRMRFLSADGKLIFELQTSDPVKTNSGPVVYAKTNLYSFVFTLSEENFDGLKIENLLKEHP